MSAFAAPQAVPRLRRFRGAAQVVARFVPLRPAGVAVLAAATASGWYGRSRLDLVLTMAGLWGLLVLAVCGLLASLAFVLCRLRLRRAAQIKHPPVEATEMVGFASGLSIGATRWPLVAAPQLAWIAPGADVEMITAGRSAAERVRPRSRGREGAILREFVVEDLLGLWRFVGRIAEERAARVLPDPGRLTPAELTASLTSGDWLAHPFGPARGDMVDFRRHTRSDPARLILWKVYARSRKLMVRAPESARAPISRPLVYLACGNDDDAAAGASRVLLESGVLGEDVPFACDGAPLPVTEREAALDSLAGSVAARSLQATDLPAAIAHDTIGPSDPVLVVLPASDRAAIARLVPLVARQPERFALIAAADCGPDAESPRWRRLAFRNAAARPGPRALAEALDPLLRTGARLVLADRTTGRVTVLGGGGVAEVFHPERLGA